MRTVDDLRIACRRPIGGALRERVRRGEEEGSLGRLVRDRAAALGFAYRGHLSKF